MSKTATLRYNPAKTEYGALLPDDTEYGPEKMPEGLLVVMADEEEPNADKYLAVLDGYEGPLDENTLYRLVPVSTEVEDDFDFEEDEPEPEKK